MLNQASKHSRIEPLESFGNPTTLLLAILPLIYLSSRYMRLVVVNVVHYLLCYTILFIFCLVQVMG